MSTQPHSDSDDSAVVEIPPPSHFAERADAGDETWLEDAIQAYLDLRLGPKQREICRSVVTNERTAVIGANGTGKTYITAAIVLAWQTVRYPAISFGTSGTGKKLYRTLCRPIDKLHGAAVGGAGLPGTFKRQPPRIDYDDPEHYFEAATPSDAGELEGAHATYTLAIIEEADKDDVTAKTIDAMRSLIPDYEGGRMLAVGNPPEDEADVFASIVGEGSAWNVVHVSSFDSWNVLVETDAREGETIDGMATVSALREDWNDYHDEPWPGVEQAWTWTDPWRGTDRSGAIVPPDTNGGAPNETFRTDLDERWYRRRGGIIPPSGAETWRPFHPPVVKRVYDDRPAAKGGRAIGSGLDVARSGDRTVLITLYPNRLVVRDTWEGTNYPQQEADVMAILDEDPDHPLAVDAAGKGRGWRTTSRSAGRRRIGFGRTANRRCRMPTG